MAAEKYNAEEVAAALTETRGMVTLAARKLGCSHVTVYRYLREYKSVAEAKKLAHESLGDQVELTLANLALGKLVSGTSNVYEREPNIAALIFLAKTKFKARGYVERTEHTGADGGAVPLEIILRQVPARGDQDA